MCIHIGDPSDGPLEYGVCLLEPVAAGFVLAHLPERLPIDLQDAAQPVPLSLGLSLEFPDKLLDFVCLVPLQLHAGLDVVEKQQAKFILPMQEMLSVALQADVRELVHAGFLQADVGHLARASLATQRQLVQVVAGLVLGVAPCVANPHL